MKDQEIREKFVEKVRETVTTVELDEEGFQEQYKHLMRRFRETGIEVCGISSGRRKDDKETWWWNSKTEEVILEKKAGLQKWKQSGMIEDKEEYERLNKKTVENQAS